MAVGGLWRPDTGLAYASLRTNTSKQKTAFSDLPFPAEVPDYPFRDDVLAYLERYADAHALRPLVRFGHAVRAVRPAPPGPDGGWTVDGEPFDAVVVATGLFARERIPELPGRERFGGTIVHSSAYRDPTAFAGRDVVVAGVGSSGADIAVDLASIARSVRVAVREMPIFSPRHYRGRPYDHRATRFARLLPPVIQRWRARRVLGPEYRRRGVVLEHLSPKRTPGMELLDALAAGTVTRHAALVGLDARGALFADGTRVDADAIILATGYEAAFPFLPGGIPERIDGALALYRLVFPPGIADLAFIGMTRVMGPVFPLAELQARWIGMVLTGRASLPAEQVMRAEAEQRIARARALHDDQMRVDFLDYADDIAGRIGTKPSLWKHPRLLVSTVTARDYAGSREARTP